MDQHVPGPVSTGLRRRRVDVMTAYEDGAARLPDPVLLDRAAARGRVLVSFDRDLLAEAKRRQELDIPFSSLISAHPDRVTIGSLLEDLEVLATICEPAEIADQVWYLPL